MSLVVKVTDWPEVMIIAERVNDIAVAWRTADTSSTAPLASTRPPVKILPLSEGRGRVVLMMRDFI
ncbi:unannotated protein [freshwater metagenome]|uniref:Unannotated protein n=1 Tax=freshwater metagenome TaxID=449393 RepID=A0A6J6C1C1_9ZZZZ